MLIRLSWRMTVPQTPIAVTAEDAGAVEHHRIADDLLSRIGINLDEAVCIYVESQFDGGIGLIHCFNASNESPIRRRPLNLTLNGIRAHSSPRKAFNCRSTVRIPSTARSQS
jgi:hypothetical protein